MAFGSWPPVASLRSAHGHREILRTAASDGSPMRVTVYLTLLTAIGALWSALWILGPSLIHWTAIWDGPFTPIVSDGKPSGPRANKASVGELHSSYTCD